jgi:nucleotide-binding universal stress UspA family protein
VGAPRREILRVLRERSADLVIMASHGEGGWKHALLGSVSESVARRAPCPVWLVPASPAYPQGETVLVGLDCSALADSAWQFALDWLPPGRMLLVAAQDGLTDLAPLRDYLAQRAHQARVAGWVCEVRVSDAPAPQAILDLARDERAQLIVLGTHGRRRLARWAFGSVAESVAQHSPCPTVLVNEAANWSHPTEEVKRHATG